MKDRFGREIDYLRISITDRCNLRCRYCMPSCGISDMGHDEILRYDEILHIAKLLSGLGIKHIKVTGGEPLARRDAEVLIKELSNIGQVEDVTMTTNGVLLSDKLLALYAAGLRAVNISLDTLDERRFTELTGADCAKDVLGAIRAATVCEGMHVKVNALALADTSEDEIKELASLARELPVDVRFIEVMPIGMGGPEQGRSREEVLDILKGAFGTPARFEEKRGNGPAVYCEFEGFKGKIGFISALSHKFCDSCNRIRLTPDGILRTCLGAEGGVNIKALLRSGASDEELLAVMKQAVYDKPKGHAFGENRDCTGRRLMSQIGG